MAHLLRGARVRSRRCEGRGGNSSLAAGERGRRFVAGERRGGGLSPVAGGQRAGLRRCAGMRRDADSGQRKLGRRGRG